jgi:septal ring factor EnvC (AmiA/AmiB activator)
VQNIEQNLYVTKESLAQLWGKVNVYQDTLQPSMDGLNQIREKLESIAQALTQIQEIGDNQLQAIADMRQTINSLMPSTEFAAS